MINKFQGGKMELIFDDGGIEYYDTVIGADGIFGSVRRHVLEDPDGQYDASPLVLGTAGRWFHMTRL